MTMKQNILNKNQLMFLPPSADVSRWWNCFAPPSITAMSRKKAAKGTNP